MGIKATDIKKGVKVEYLLDKDDGTGCYFRKGDIITVTSYDVHARKKLIIYGYTTKRKDINLCYATSVRLVKDTKKKDTVTKVKKKKKKGGKILDATKPLPEVNGKDIITNARAELKCIGLTEERAAVELAVKGDFPILLVGETGQGKSYLLSSMAKEHGKTLVNYTLNGEVSTLEFLGKWLIDKDKSTYWVDGVLTDAIRTGKWLHLAEINMALPEILAVLNGVLDDTRCIVLAEKTGEVVERHPDFRIFASMNPPDEYVGTKEINKALLSRFAMVIPIEHYKPEEELQILQYQSGISMEIGSIMVDIGNAIRKLKEDKKIWYTCGTRDLVNWARLIACNGNTFQDTFEYSILNKCSTEDRKIIMDKVKTASKVEFKWTAKKEEFKLLTEDMQKDIEKMRKEKDELRISLDKLGEMVTKVKATV